MTEPTQPTQQKAISSVEKELFQDHPHLSLEEKYQRLQQAYQNVCLERDLLRKALRLYVSYPGVDSGRK